MAILPALLFMAPIWLTIGILTSKKGSDQREGLKGCLTLVMILLSPALILGTLITLPALYPEPSGPEPQVWSAEFPFTLSYTVDGVPVTVQDTMNCWFFGYMWNSEGKGSHREWHDSYGDRRNHGQLLYQQEDVEEYYDGTQWVQLAGNVEGWDEEKQYDLKIRMWIGDPAYYMGDAEEPSEDYPHVAVGVYEHGIGHRLVGKTLYGEEIYDSPILDAYGVQITDWEITADPIENSFSEPDEGKT